MIFFNFWGQNRFSQGEHLIKEAMKYQESNHIKITSCICEKALFLNASDEVARGTGFCPSLCTWARRHAYSQMLS